MKISYIIPFRNRGKQRLKNCINSLLKQTNSDVEVIVSVFGGDNPFRTLSFNEKVRPVYTKTMEVWNRGKALNIGMSIATGDIIVCTDVDMIFCRNVAKRTVEIISNDKTAFVYSNIIMMTERDWEMNKHRPIKNVDLGFFVRENNNFSMVGTGGYQAMHKDMWKKVKGFKHCYKGWGVEDIDLYKRALKYAHPLRLTKVLIVHQWHKSGQLNPKIKPYVEANTQMGYGTGEGDLNDL